MLTSRFMTMLSRVTGWPDLQSQVAPPTTATTHWQPREARQVNLQKLFIQITDCPDPDMVGTTISCETRETSANGLGIVASTCIPIGSLLDLWVNVSARQEKYFVSGEVRWVSDAQAGNYHMGIELASSEVTDIDAWRALHA